MTPGMGMEALMEENLTPQFSPGGSSSRLRTLESGVEMEVDGSEIERPAFQPTLGASQEEGEEGGPPPPPGSKAEA